MTINIIPLANHLKLIHIPTDSESGLIQLWFNLDGFHKKPTLAYMTAKCMQLRFSYPFRPDIKYTPEWIGFMFSINQENRHQLFNEISKVIVDFHQPNRIEFNKLVKMCQQQSSLHITNLKHLFPYLISQVSFKETDLKMGEFLGHPNHFQQLSSGDIKDCFEQMFSKCPMSIIVHDKVSVLNILHTIHPFLNKSRDKGQSDLLNQVELKYREAIFEHHLSNGWLINSFTLPGQYHKEWIYAYILLIMFKQAGLEMSKTLSWTLMPWGHYSIFYMPYFLSAPHMVEHIKLQTLKFMTSLGRQLIDIESFKIVKKYIVNQWMSALKNPADFDNLSSLYLYQMNHPDLNLTTFIEDIKIKSIRDFYFRYININHTSIIEILPEGVKKVKSIEFDEFIKKKILYNPTKEPHLVQQKNPETSIELIRASQNIPLHIITQSTNTLTLGMIYNFGSSYESDESGGVTSLYMHLMKTCYQDLKGRLLPNEDFHFEVKPDYSYFYFSVPSENWLEGVSVLNQLISLNEFEESWIHQQKNIILSKILSDKNNIFIQAKKQFYQALFNHHQYSRPILGSSESLNKLNNDELLSLKNNLYSKDNYHLIMTGNLSEQSLKKINKFKWNFLKEKPSRQIVNDLSSDYFSLRGYINHEVDICFNYNLAGIAIKDVNHLKDYICLIIISKFLNQGLPDTNRMKDSGLYGSSIDSLKSSKILLFYGFDSGNFEDSIYKRLTSFSNHDFAMMIQDLREEFTQLFQSSEKLWQEIAKYIYLNYDISDFIDWKNLLGTVNHWDVKQFIDHYLKDLNQWTVVVLKRGSVKR